MAGLWLQVVPGVRAGLGVLPQHFLGQPQLPAPYSLAGSTSSFCHLKASFHWDVFYFLGGLKWMLKHPFSRAPVCSLNGEEVIWKLDAAMKRWSWAPALLPWAEDLARVRNEELLSSQRKDSRKVHGLVKTCSSELGTRKVKPMELHDLLRKLSEQLWKVTWCQEPILARKEESSVSNETNISSSSSVKTEWNFDGWYVWLWAVTSNDD